MGVAGHASRVARPFLEKNGLHAFFEVHVVKSGRLRRKREYKQAGDAQKAASRDPSAQIYEKVWGHKSRVFYTLISRSARPSVEVIITFRLPVLSHSVCGHGRRHRAKPQFP